MRRRNTLILFALVFSACAQPTRTTIPDSTKIEAFRRITILPFQAKIGSGEAMADAFVTGFMASGFVVVERGLLEGVFQELKIDFSEGVLKPDDLKRVGESGKIDAVIFGTINTVPGSKRGAIHAVSLRMVDVLTGQVVLSSTYRNTAGLEPQEIPNKMMSDIRKKYRRALYR